MAASKNTLCFVRIWYKTIYVEINSSPSIVHSTLITSRCSQRQFRLVYDTELNRALHAKQRANALVIYCLEFYLNVYLVSEPEVIHLAFVQLIR